jgi:hypothetical protein
LEEVKMRKRLLLSTGIICLMMLAPGLSYGQGPSGRSEEPKRMQPGDTGKDAAKGTAKGTAKGAASQEKGQERAQERAPGAEKKTQGAAGREEKGTGARQAGEKSKAAPSSERPTAASDDSKRGRGEGAKPGERAQDTRQGKDSAKDSAKSGAEMKRDKAAGGKSGVESEKSKAGTAASQKEREGTATTQKEPGRDQKTSKDAAEQSKDRPATATTTGISTDKQVRISETLTRERLAPPQRNLNISIRVGERIPRHVRVQRLPAAIVSIEPQYRGYDYFTTEEEIIIVEPRTQRIVSHIPRDASRIRAAETGGGRAGDAMAAAGGAPCRIMRRDTAGNITEVSPTTVGSTAAQDSLSVTVRAPGGGGSTNPIALGASDGQIVVAMQGGDCTVTIEPQPR